MGIVLWPLAKLFEAGAKARAHFYTSGRVRQQRLGRPVVSIGNLSVGGTGKTPFTIWLFERLRERGLHPAVLTRGYKRPAGRPTLILRESYVPESLSLPRVTADAPLREAVRTALEAQFARQLARRYADDARMAGDEVQVMLRHGVAPIGVDANRFRAGRLLESLASDTAATEASDTAATEASDTAATEASDTAATEASDRAATEASDRAATEAREAGRGVCVPPHGREGAVPIGAVPIGAIPIPPPDLFLLDDGFQHLSLARDLDIVLIDSSKPPWKDRALPAGLLREPLSALTRAQFVVITRVQEWTDYEYAMARVKVAAPRVEVLAARTRIGFEDPPRGLAFAFAGIGNPKAFFGDLCLAGVKVIGTRSYRDHHRYTASDLRDLVRRALAIGAGELVTTEKDAVNISAELRESLGLPLRVAEMQLEVEGGEKLLGRIDSLAH